MIRNCLFCKEETENNISIKISDRSVRRNGVYQIVYNSVVCKKCLRKVLKSSKDDELIKKESTTKSSTVSYQDNCTTLDENCQKENKKNEN